MKYKFTNGITTRAFKVFVVELFKKAFQASNLRLFYVFNGMFVFRNNLQRIMNVHACVHSCMCLFNFLFSLHVLFAFVPNSRTENLMNIQIRVLRLLVADVMPCTRRALSPKDDSYTHEKLFILRVRRKKFSTYSLFLSIFGRKSHI